MIRCSNCKREKNEDLFINNKNKICKTCNECRENTKKWKDNNKETISLYNKYKNSKKNVVKTIEVIYSKKKDYDEEWTRHLSQNEAARNLNLYSSNINKVLNGSISQTGGYIFKKEYVLKVKEETKTWNEIKIDNNIIEKCKGQPSLNRIKHEVFNNIKGKKCCTCKSWYPLTEYNKSKSNWDELRNDCKLCLAKYRKDNRIILNEKHKLYDKNRKKIDPEYKLLKTLRSRIGTAIIRNNSIKSTNTINLLGGSIEECRKHLESKFKDGMNWNNHGKWHIDHIIPCSSFNLSIEEEQKKCFHYSNLQPLWAYENLSKGNKIL
uniref:DNA endonuclease I-HmuI-like NUMOD-like domain-containing protein n=1 Tax=viral metagenome TaxID=1070528 RepID=A0A6C0I720_9ZZZZ